MEDRYMPDVFDYMDNCPECGDGFLVLESSEIFDRTLVQTMSCDNADCLLEEIVYRWEFQMCTMRVRKSND